MSNRLEGDSKVEGLGQRLKAFRSVNGWSQSWTADILGVSAPTLARWEAGSAEPSGEHLRRVVRLLGLRSRGRGLPREHLAMLQLSLFPERVPSLLAGR
ncbi:MAG: helix-turn-helix transcriptional regulator [Candidatus Bipolaricaulota bacterium]